MQSLRELIQDLAMWTVVACLGALTFHYVSKPICDIPEREKDSGSCACGHSCPCWENDALEIKRRKR
jgi:hypothetical protein